MPQSPKDLISQFLFLYPTKDVSETTVIDLIQPIFVRTTKGQLGIPKLDHKVVQVPMTQLQREIYKTLKSEVRRQLNPTLSDSSRYELRRIGKCVMKVMEFVYCQIKRGEKVNKKLYPAAWQNTTNEELGQFLLSFVYQKPGTARGSKASICGNKERYHLLFSKKYNSGLLSDLLKIKAFYKLWASRVKKTDDGTDPYKVGLVNNGMFFMTAIIGIVCKIYYRPNVINQITTSVMSEQKLEVVAQHDIDHPIFRLDLEKKEQFLHCLNIAILSSTDRGTNF